MQKPPPWMRLRRNGTSPSRSNSSRIASSITASSLSTPPPPRCFPSLSLSLPISSAIHVLLNSIGNFSYLRSASDMIRFDWLVHVKTAVAIDSPNLAGSIRLDSDSLTPLRISIVSVSVVSVVALPVIERVLSGLGHAVIDGRMIRWVMLYGNSEQMLECRILKNDEVVCCGETLTFSAYLVDVGEPEGGQKPLNDTYIHNRAKKVAKRTTSLHRNKFVNVSHCAGIVRPSCWCL